MYPAVQNLKLDWTPPSAVSVPHPHKWNTAIQEQMVMGLVVSHLIRFLSWLKDPASLLMAQFPFCTHWLSPTFHTQHKPCLSDIPSFLRKCPCLLQWWLVGKEVGFGVTKETYTWACLWGHLQRGLSEVGWSTMTVDSIIPWAEFLKE